MNAQIEIQNTTEIDYQRPDVGIVEVINDQKLISFERGTFPWIPDVDKVPTAQITLDTGDVFRYGSLVGQSSQMIKYAEKVSDEESHKAEIGLFKALPQLLAKDSAELPKNIDIVPSYTGIEGAKLYKVAKQGKNAGRLYFTLIHGKSGVTVVKLGLAQHDKQVAMQNYMSGNRSRQKHDG
jgi:hypothetical protein